MSVPSQVLLRKPNAIAPSQAESAKSAKIKSPYKGEKVVIRRLPPGLSEEEFGSILGDIWKVGNGKVDWASYVPGKTTQHSSKISRPSRAYLHVLNHDDLIALSEVVRTAVWEDAAETCNDSALAGPPVVEICTYKKLPNAKTRVDSRQRTIDQDPEFMAFLESLANPDTQKGGEADGGVTDNVKPDKVTTTPLVDYLREKKAAKAKEVAAAKSAKNSRLESLSKGKVSAPTVEDVKKKLKDSKGDKSTEKPKGSVKILTKKAATDAAAEAAKTVANQIISPAIATSAATNNPETPSKARRAGIAAAARILQRDLGLSPGIAHKKARQDAVKADKADFDAKPMDTANENGPVLPVGETRPLSLAGNLAIASAAPKEPAPSSRFRGKRRGMGGLEESLKIKGENKGEKASETLTAIPHKAPVVLLMKKVDNMAPSHPVPSQAAQSTLLTASSQDLRASSPSPSAPLLAAPTGPKAAFAKQGGAAGRRGASNNTVAVPSPGSTRAFCKHANPSQGVTQPLLREAMQAFGGVTDVEIDRRKGFAYVEFAEPDGLAKAMAASPVAVAQGSVQVLERKETANRKRTVSATSTTNVASSGGNAGNSDAITTGISLAVPVTSADVITPPSGPTAAKEDAKTDRRGRGRRGGRGRGREREGGRDTVKSGNRNASGSMPSAVPGPNPAPAVKEGE